jgi:Fe-S-cluster containining protein
MRQLGSDAPTKMREMMELGFLLPSGLVSSPNRQLQTMKSSQKHDFGNYVDVVCDHLKENGDCGIYEHRNSVCSTWFCSFGTNKYAGDWWTKLRDLVAHSEQSLCQWSMGKVGLDMEQFRKTFDEFSLDIESMGNKSNGAWSSEFLKEVWQGYDPAEFFKLCAKEIVEHQGQLSKIVSQTSLLIPKTYHKNITQWLTRQATDQSYQKVNADVQYEGVEQLLRQIREIQDSVLLEEELEALRN